DFALSEEQEMLRKSARDFLTAHCPKSVVREIEESDAGYSTDLWRKMADLGWLGLNLPEEYGGAGLSLLDLAVLFEEFGRAALHGPMSCTMVLGALPVMDYGDGPQREGILPEVARGKMILTMAVSEANASEEPRFSATRAASEKNNLFLTGTKLFVPYAHVADKILTLARTEGNPGDSDGLTLFILDRDQPGVSLSPMVNIAADRKFEMRLERVPAGKDIIGARHAAMPVVRSTLEKAAAIQCAEMVGGAQQELEITAEHARTRVQFDRPLGSFQAVQHRLADMFIDVNGARWVTYQAIWRLSEGLPAEREVSIAKAFTNLACLRVAGSAQQLHGGIGVDKAYDLHFYFRRAKAFELSLGGTYHHLQTLEAELAQQPRAH
ncbi:MAG: acyl-CoA/acyl-ACP dehydrogenase, partial [Dehalococcoidia bacterium]|nr:acyl-CoA/acyl-ACP dehydrogenase [Dehalococcoidia bacterium]